MQENEDPAPPKRGVGEGGVSKQNKEAKQAQERLREAMREVDIGVGIFSQLVLF